MKLEKLCKDVLMTIIQKMSFEVKFKTISNEDLNKLRKSLYNYIPIKTQEELVIKKDLDINESSITEYSNYYGKS